MRAASLAVAVAVATACGRDALRAPPPPAPARAERDGATDSTVPSVPRPSGRCGVWETIARGVSRRRCDRAGGHAAVFLAGWAIRTPGVRAWADALDEARLATLGVTTLFAVDGPAEVDFRSKDLPVDDLLRALRADLGPGSWALVAAHSSGAHVAATLFHRAFARGQASELSGRVVYVDLDGDAGVAHDPERDLLPASMAGVRHALFVATRDAASGLEGFSRAAMEAGARRFPAVSSLWTYDASGAACTSAACVHLALVDQHPTARGNVSYGRSTAATVNTAWLSRVEAWLSPRPGRREKFQ